MDRSILRNRPAYALMGALVIVAGLTIRSRAFYWLPYVPKYGGDALWAVMFFLIVGWLFPLRPTRQIALAAATITLLIEIGKLYHSPGLDRFRHTTAGSLTLGHTFTWGAIAAYLFGVAVAAGVERAVIVRRERKSLECGGALK